MCIEIDAHEERKMHISIDVEANGPCPGIYSMLEIGAVAITEELDRIFYGNLKPVTEFYEQDALNAIGRYSHEETLSFMLPVKTMNIFFDWCQNLLLESGHKRLYFISDNAGFDWQFVNYYFHRYIGENPFGYSSISLTSLYKGIDRNMMSSFTHLRKTKHTHHPVDDAKGNAEAFLEMKKMGIKTGKLW